MQAFKKIEAAIDAEQHKRTVKGSDSHQSDFEPLWKIENDDPRVNDLGNYTADDTTHIHVVDESKDYELIGRYWVEKAPF